MKNKISKILKKIIPFIPSSEFLNNHWWHKSFFIIVGLLLIAMVSGSIFVIFRAENLFYENLTIFLFLTSLSFLIVNLLSFVYWFILKLFMKTKINKIKSSSWIYALILLVILLIQWLFLDKIFYVKVSKWQNYNSYFDNQYSIEMIGDWDDDNNLAKEVNKHKINCNKDTEKCEWITASIQEWNNNYFSVEKSDWPIIEWSDKIVRAKNELETLTEEITFYRDRCKMVYVKTPTGETGLFGFFPDDITLTMSSSYCKSK